MSLRKRPGRTAEGLGVTLGAHTLGTAEGGLLSPQSSKPPKLESSSSSQLWLWAEDVFLGCPLRQTSLSLRLVVFCVQRGAPVGGCVLHDLTLRVKLIRLDPDWNNLILALGFC